MTFYLESRKLIEWAETAVKRYQSKRWRWILGSMYALLLTCCVIADIAAAPSCLGTLFALSFIALNQYGVRRQIRRLPHMYRETITLEDEEMILRDSDGNEIMKVRYCEIVSMEGRSLTPAIMGGREEDGRAVTRVGGPLDEEIKYICLFRGEIQIKNGEYAAYYRKMYEEIILFPFEQTAWDFLRGRVPTKENADIRCWNRY